VRHEGVLGRPPFERIALILQGGGTLRQARSDRASRWWPRRGAAHNVRANVICPGFVRTPPVDKQIPEMLKETVDGEFTTTDDVADAPLFAGARRSALAGQSMVVSHGWFMR
jgi:NAD(P)-dependent dehydrogenase (short-subunit alcohol dehydrogenase family)